ncbi:MAG TPA: slipin family protein [Arenimonas sp.]|uniref:slipin family protein n=1 Tax=Arenimonas sp. TaxID=1872635 RepID=UPI002BA4A8D8|nr:slipin family protein [Arenimonas sp.]HMB56786.1 slipin family protein [Arenimonas sp.]
MNAILTLCVVSAIVIAVSGFRICQEYQRAVVFRLGRFQAVRGPGWYWNIPLIEWQRRLDMRTCTVDIEQQETVSRDSVTIKVNAVLWFRIVDPERAVISIQDYRAAVYQVALTSLRNIIGQHDLDDVLKSRDRINETLRAMVDEATDPWGLSVEMVEMKDVEIPIAMQRAMAREAEAVREKRARIIKAEAELESSVKLRDAAQFIADNPAALELRRMQMVTEVGAEHNTTTLIMMPSDFMTLAKRAGDYLQAKAS